MGKITKKAVEKHKVSLSPALVDFIQATCTLPLQALPRHLSQLPTRWPFPRGDLYNWIEPLDRFDTILHTFVEHYGLDKGPQTERFGLSVLLKGSPDCDEKKLRESGFGEDGDRELIETILSFSRLLLDKCGNRALYNSSDRLNDLLNTTSLSLLHSALRITVFLAQRYSERPSNTAQQQHSQFYAYDHERLNKLAAPFASSSANASKQSASSPTKTARGKEKGPPAGRLRRSSTSVNPNDFKVLLRPGKKNTDADNDGASHSAFEREWQPWASVKVTWTLSADRKMEQHQMHDPTSNMPVSPTPARRQSSMLSRTSTSYSIIDAPASAGSMSSPEKTNPQSLELSAAELSGTTIEDVLRSVPQDMPASVRYELLYKLRIAYGLMASLQSRQALLAVRLLALAVLAYIYDEHEFPQKVFGPDANPSVRIQLVQQIVSLVQNPKNGQEEVSLYLQTLGMETLGVLARQRTMSNEITVAMAPNSSHGLLLTLTEKGLEDLRQDNNETDSVIGDDWREAIFSLLSAFMVHTLHSVRASETFIHPSLISAYVSGLNIVTEKALRVHLRILDFMKSFCHQFKDGLTVLSSKQAFEAACELLGKLSDSALQLLREGKGMPEEFKTKVTDYRIPYMHQQVIRSMIDLVNDIIGHQGGHAERILRNLVDSRSLLKAFHLILSNIDAFGAHTWSEVVKATVGFLHNEPTSYTIVSEAGITGILLDMVVSPRSEGLPASTETVSDVPKQVALDIPANADAIVNLSQAFGAICLTSAGFDNFRTSGALEKFFEIFESPAHVKVIKDSNTLALLGSTFDELVRHHPPLKNAIVSVAITMMARVRHICRSKAWETGAGAKLWLESGSGQLVVAGGHQALTRELVSNSSSESISQTIQLPGGGSLHVASEVGEIDPSTVIPATEADSDGLTVVDYARSAVCFLLNFFENQSMCSFFMEQGATDIVLDYITLPALSADDQTFGSEGMTREIATLVHMMAETKPHLVLPVLTDRARFVCTEALDSFVRDQDASFGCHFAPLVQPQPNGEAMDVSGGAGDGVIHTGTKTVKGLTSIYLLMSILSEIFSMPMYNTRGTGPSSIFFQLNVADIMGDLCRMLGSVAAACYREEIALQRMIPESWLAATRPGEFSTGDDEVDKVLNVQDSKSESLDTEGSLGEEQKAKNSEALKAEKQSAAFKNVRTLRYLLIETPASISEFFQRLGRGIVTKRNRDSTSARHRSNIVAAALADAHLAQLRPEFLSPELPSNEDIKVKEARFAYLLLALAYVRNSITDDTLGSGPSTGRQSLVIDHFQKAGGMKRLTEIGTEFFDELKSCKVAQSIFSANTGLKHCLDILDDVTSVQNICESHHGQWMKETSTNKPYYFNPAQLLLELRIQALSLTEKIWDSDYADQASADVIQKLISILKHVFNGEQENDAFQSANSLPKFSQQHKRKFAISNDVVTKIVSDKGFPEDLVREAIYRSNCVGNSNTRIIEEYCVAVQSNPRRRRLPAPEDEVESGSPNSRTGSRPSGNPSLGDLPTLVEGAHPVIDATLEEVVSSINGNDMDDLDDDDDLMEDRGPAVHDNTSSAMHLSNILNEPDAPTEEHAATISRSESGAPAPFHYTVEVIDEHRENIRHDLAERCNNILNNHPNLKFDLSELIISATQRLSDDAAKVYWGDTCDLLIKALLSRQDEEEMTESQANKIGAAAHLIALLIQDNDVFKSTMRVFQESFEGIVAFLRLPPLTVQTADDSSSPWVGPLLLILEKMLSLDAEPAEIKWSAPNDLDPAQPPQLTYTDVFQLSEKKELFELLIAILPRVGKDRTTALSIVRVLVMLTRVREIATMLGQRGNLQRLFLMIKQLGNGATGRLHNSFMLILRHIIEDEETIRQIMRSEITASFVGRSGSRPHDLTSYVRDNFHLALRAPELFVEVSNEKIKLSSWSPHSSNSSLVLKETDGDQDSSEVQQPSGNPDTGSANRPTISIETGDETAEEIDKNKATESKPPVVENPDGIVHFLLSELLAYKDVEDKEQPKASNGKAPETQENSSEQGQDDQAPSTGIDSIALSGDKQDKAKFKADDHPIFLYRCFILHCLTELLYSYNRTKIEFINFSRKADPMAVTPSKPRSGILNYLLSALVSSGYVDKDETITCKKSMALSDWAMRVIVALCTKTGEMGLAGPSQRFQPLPQVDDQDTEPDLAFVRRFVLEHAIKAFKDATASVEPLQTKYGRLLCLADLFRRLLTKPAGPDGTAGTHNNSYKMLGRMMFEKNLISVLTSSLAEIDLSFPSAKKVIKFILRPMQELTTLAVHLSMSSPEAITSVMGNDQEDVISSASSASVSDIDDDGREETPDLFRNSALGMLDPGRQGESDTSEDEDEDEEMYDDEYDDEMDYDEGGMAPNDGEVISDEEIEQGLEDVGPIEGIPGDVPMDIEFVVNGAHDMHSEDDDEDEDSEDDEDEDSDDDDENDDFEIEIDDAGEINADDEGDSLGNGHENEGDWEDEDGDDGEEDDEDEEEDDEDGNLDVTFQGDDLAIPPDLGIVEGHAELNNLLRVLAGSNRDGMPPPPQLTAQDDDGDHEQDDEEDDEGDEGDDIDDGDGMDYGDGFLMTDGFDDLERGGPWDNFDEPPPFFHRHRHSAALGRNLPGFVNRRIHALGEHDVHHHHHHHHHAMGVRHHRHPPQPRGTVDDGANPLLERPENSGAPRSTSDSQLYQGTRPAMFPPPILPTADGRSVVSVPVTMSLPLGGGNAPPTASEGPHGAVLDAIVHALQQGNNPFASTGRLFGNGIQVHLNAPVQDMREMMRTMSAGIHGRQPREDPARAAAFNPTLTAIRWQEEARMLFGSVYVDKAQRVQILIMSRLVPPAQKEEKERRLKRAEEDERRKKEAEEAEKRRLEEERLRKEQEEREAAERVEAAARARAEAAAAAEAARVAADLTASHNQHQGAEPMDGVQATHEPGDNATSEEPAAEPARIFTTIRGRQLDITGLDIDLEYLEALPEDLREEVIMAQYTERRENAQEEGGDASAIDPDFLNALPEDIREEIRQQEAHLQRRRQREEARRQAQQAAGGPQAEDMDNDNFFATLDPALRRTILAEQTSEVLATLNPITAAEGRAQQRGMFYNGLNATRHQRNNGRSRPDQAQRDSKRQVVQLIDKAGVATLLRLMFLPQQGSLRQNLWTILSNVCGNRQTRFEVISLLLIILKEGSTDIGAVERSLANLSLRAKAVATAKTPQELKRTLSMPSQAGLGDEVTPMTVVQQCLAALQALCRLGVHVRTIFLREVDVAPAKAAKKGKGKENKSVKYPINDLISLLDRRLIMDSSNCLQALAELLASVTSPLTFFMKKDKEQSEGRKGEEAQQDQALQADTAPAETERPSTSGQDTAMIEAPSTSQPTQSDAAEGDSAANEDSASKTQGEDNSQEEKKKAFEPPVISEHNLRLVTSVFVAPECHNETFHSILETLTSLSYIPGTSIIFSKELINHVQALSHAICADLDELLPLIKEATSTSDLQGITSAKFSAGSSDQVKLLRVLQALDYLSAPKKDSEVEEESASVKSILNSSYDTLALGPLWNKLSDCLTAVREKGDTIGFANILLPLIESLMVVCKNTPLKDTPVTGQAQEAVIASPVLGGMNDLEELFFKFTAEHRKILNDIVRQNPKLMQGNGNFSLLVKNSKVLDFDNKRNYFTKQIHSRHHQRHVQPPLQLSPRRDHVFLDSFKSLYFKTAEEMKYGKLNIRFLGEEGVDAGGVTREWFHVLARGMFNPDYGLFQPVASDRTTFHPNPLSGINNEHLLYFKFVGRIIGKAVHEGRVLDCHFSRAVYKRILGKSPNLKDLESNDVDYYKSLVWILENDITDILTEEFCVIEDSFGEEKIIDLIPDGRNIAVTEQNKKEYVQKLVEYRLTESVSEQLDNFLQGFHDIIPAELIAIFNEQELELLISGLPEIDVDDWKANTEYHNYSPSSTQIVWFWRIVRGMTNEERAKLLQFITGTSKVPLNGFKELEGVSGLTKHNIHKDPSTTRLPTSHTCFNQLDLPAYDSFDLMKQNLMTAINLGADYFGFA